MERAHPPIYSPIFLLELDLAFWRYLWTKLDGRWHHLRDVAGHVTLPAALGPIVVWRRAIGSEDSGSTWVCDVFGVRHYSVPSTSIVVPSALAIRAKAEAEPGFIRRSISER